MRRSVSDPPEDTDSSSIPSDASYVKRLFGLLLYSLQRLGTDRGRLQGHFVSTLLKPSLSADTPRGRLSFVAMGKTAAQRVQSVLTKQPETIQWIESFAPNSVFWDVGANVGVFTLYAALRRDTRVVAVEPAAVNYFALAANCEANRFDDRVDCLLVGLGRSRRLGHIEMSQFAPGMSFSFEGQRDRPYESRQAALIVSMDELVEDYGLPSPNYIKIDVPGLTEEVIDGAARTLQRPDVRAIHMEMREDSKGGRRLVDTLSRYGFVRTGRHRENTTDVTYERLSTRT